MTARRFAGNLASAVVGIIVGATVMLAIDGVTRDRPPRPSSTALLAPSPSIEISPREMQRGTQLLLAWSPGGIPRRAEAMVENLPGVSDATLVAAGLEWISKTRTAEGTVVDAAAEGMGIPFEIAVVDPGEYARFVPPSERAAIQALDSDSAVLAETSVDIRGGGEGLEIAMDGRTVTVSAVADDIATNGYEALIAPPVPATWQRVDTYLLMKVTERARRSAIERALLRLLGPGRLLRVRAEGETPFLRYGDAVLPQLLIKEAFGEFAARPRSDGTIEIEDAWRRSNIVTRSVPILGRVMCHRALFPQLRAALGDLKSRGLSFLIDPGDYGGCFSARFIDSNPGGRLSHHSWGIAIDLNVSTNRPGTKSDQDDRVVAAFEDAGFTWGGRWLIPDAMHFEWVRFS